jgi:flap endonuclease-1
MGIPIGKILPSKEIELAELRQRKIAIDAYNTLMQFLSIIRLPTGEPLRDSRGRITSHLSGILYRMSYLLERGILPCLVFDGPEKPLKGRVMAEREERRREAERKYEEAKKAGRWEEVAIYAQQMARVTDDIVEGAKRLLTAMGIPWIQAVGDGEAQCAYVCQKGEVYATGSQDWDSLLFGSPRLIRNLSITGRRKLPRKKVYVEIKPELVELESALATLGLTREQLIILGMLVGTDYNPGVRGVGPKTALKLVKSYKTLDRVLCEVEWQTDVDPHEIYNFFIKPPLTDEYEMRWGKPDPEKLRHLMVDEHDFSTDRVEKVIERLQAACAARKQASLRGWLGN